MFGSWVLPQWLDLVDIALVAGFAWLAIRSFRQTRARAAFSGLAVVAVVYFVARGLDLRLTASLLQAFFAVAVLVLVVIFQEDLRRVFEEIGSWRSGKPPVPDQSRTLDMLARSVARLAATRMGALIVLPGEQPLDRHIEGGIALGGKASEPLLLSLFDKNSPGHDGAVVLRGDSIERFALHLPLSTNYSAMGAGGTRHAAALGLAERCDAVCVVVSEERGTVSVARDGQLHTLARPEDLIAALRSDVAEPEERVRSWGWGGSSVDAVLAIAIAVVLWIVLIAGSNVVERTFDAQIAVTNLPPQLHLNSVEPTKAEVTLRGFRRDLLLAARDKVTVEVDAYLASLGRRTFSIRDEDVRAREDLIVVAIEPERVKLDLAPTNLAAPAPTPPPEDER
jgi:diadenylate cyclase